jgi:hypothetical protein
MEKRVTIATIKSFIRKHGDAVHIRYLSSFDGMTDCVQSFDGPRAWHPRRVGEHPDHDLGIAGAWFVLRSRDYLSPITEDGFTGYHVSNSCGSFDLAVRL